MPIRELYGAFLFRERVASSKDKRRVLAWSQGCYYTLTGPWPLVDVTSFMSVTGPKVDVWLVRTVGGLLAVTGVALGLAEKRKHISADLDFIAGGQAAVLCAIDLIYLSRADIGDLPSGRVA